MGVVGHKRRAMSAAKAKMLAREYEAVKLRAEGKTEKEIAAHFGLTQQGISKMLLRAETRLYSEEREALNRTKLKLSMTLRRLAFEAEGAWYASKKESVTETVTQQTMPASVQQDGKTKPAAPMPITLKRERKNQNGDPAYLNAALKAWAADAKLWGLNAPTKVSLVREQTDEEKMTEADLLAQAERELDELRQRHDFPQLPEPITLTGELVTRMEDDDDGSADDAADDGDGDGSGGGHGSDETGDSAVSSGGNTGDDDDG